MENLFLDPQQMGNCLLLRSLMAEEERDVPTSTSFLKKFRVRGISETKGCFFLRRIGTGPGTFEDRYIYFGQCRQGLERLWFR